MEEFNKYGRIIGAISAIVLLLLIGVVKGCIQKDIRDNAINNAIDEYNEDE
jgi:hypothetical protein